jgi:hypothetical protein
LKANVDASAYSPTNRVILNTLKKYGAILADNGGDWSFQGTPDPRWDDEDLHQLVQIVPYDQFEVVDTTPWIVNRDSGEALSGDGSLGETWPKPGAVLAIDFDDPGNIVTAPGFTSFATNAYSSSRGYGWQSTSGLETRLRANSSDPLWRDIVTTAFPSEQTFLIDLPNGAYSVTVFLGDAAFPANQGVTVSAEGVQQFTLPETPAGQRIINTFTARVMDGQLSLQFGPVTSGSLALAGLEIHALSTDIFAPVAFITSPLGGRVSGVIPFRVLASDNLGVTHVEFLLDGAVGVDDLDAPFEQTLDTTKLSDGAHSLGARAYDAAGNIGVAEPLTVYVENGAATPSIATDVPIE